MRDSSFPAVSERKEALMKFGAQIAPPDFSSNRLKDPQKSCRISRGLWAETNLTAEGQCDKRAALRNRFLDGNHNRKKEDINV